MSHPLLSAEDPDGVSGNQGLRDTLEALRWVHDNAAALAALDIPAFACTPGHFPDLMAAAVNRQNLREWAGQNGIAVKG